MKKRLLLLTLLTALLLAAVWITPLLAQNAPSPLQTANTAPTEPIVSAVPNAPSTPAATVDTAATKEEATKPRLPVDNGSAHILDVDAMVQDTLESGCEVYSAIMLLHHYGFEIDEFTFAEDYLTVYPTWFGDDGSYYGPDLNSAFAGEVEWGYGAYAPALATAINRYLSAEASPLDAVFQKGTTLEALCEECLRRDRPAMVWLTTDMALPEDCISWIVDYVDENAEYEEGEEISWPVNEHCMLLCGYDDDSYYFADPLEGAVVAYEKPLCEEIFAAMDGQTVYLTGAAS